MKTTFQLFADAPLARHMLELSPAAVAVLDNAGVVVFVNERLTQLLGYSSTDLVGRSSKMFLPGTLLCDPATHPAVGLSHFGNEQFVKDQAHVAKCKDGLDVPVNISLHRIVGSQGSLWLTHLVRADKRPVDRDLLESERLAAIAQMVSGLAHESRNALQRAVASLDLLELDLAGNPEQMALSQRIRRSLADLLENYDEVRRYAEPIAVKVQCVDLLSLCQVALNELTAKKPDSDCRLEFLPATEQEGVAYVDREKIKLVFRHILENAIDAAGEAPAYVEVGCQRLGWRGDDAIRLRIRDHGFGFGDDALCHAFQRFYTTKQHGTGLGLAICRRIVEAHHGEIRAENHVDGGAVIDMILPVSPPGS